MIIKTVDFLGSFPNNEKCPKSKHAEFAFIGRSNVGKSSLINMLLGRKNIARVSSTPGKTQLINIFNINKEDNPWILTDLPGYGYAKLSKSQRAVFDGMIRGYLTQRENLTCVFLLIDIRIPPQKNDLEFANWLGANQIPFVYAFTKTDKISKNQIASSIAKYKKVVLKQWEQFPNYFASSSVSSLGKENILDFVEEYI